MNAPALALDTIMVDVAFYDDAEKQKLLAILWQPKSDAILTHGLLMTGRSSAVSFAV